jgi:hypothetical protein
MKTGYGSLLVTHNIFGAEKEEKKINAEIFSAKPSAIFLLCAKKSINSCADYFRCPGLSLF